MDATTLQRLLRERGVEPLLVSGNSRDPLTLVIYLHGNHGRLQQEETIAFLGGLPGVRAVEVSEASWTILRVRLTPS